MFTGFQHSIAGGNGNLIATSVQSPNFVHGSTGWRIAKDGSAEFHDIIIPAGSGGAVITFSSTAPVSPNVGDLWYNTSAGLEVSQWNGTSWVAYQISSGAIANGGISQANLNAAITARALGGITTTISSSAPASPATGDIWINTSSGNQLEQYNGSAFVPITWTATNVISAGTINASLIAAATITGSLIAAGTITASNIQSATITASQIAANTITAAQIQANSLTGSVMGNLGACLNVNPFFAGGSGTGWTTSGSGNTFTVVPASSLTSPPFPGYGAQVTFATSGASADKFNGSADKFGVTVGNRYAATAWVYSSNAVTVNFGFEWRNSSNSPFSTQTSAFAVPANTWTLVNTVQTAQATAVSGDLTFWTSANTTLTVQAAQAFPQIPGIVDATTINAATINGGTITGTIFDGTNFIINSSGIFFYTGTPALGNLTASIVPASVSGSDQFGNTYLAGSTTYVSIGGAVTGTVAVSSLDATITWFYSTSTTGSGTYRETGQMLCEPTVSNTGPNTFLLEVLDNTGSSVLASMAMNGSSTVPGINVQQGSFSSGAGTVSNPTVITTDTWHGATLTNPGDWTQVVNLAYTLNADNTVSLVGELNSTGIIATSRQLTSLPAAYRPTSNVRLSANYNTGTGTVGAVLITISTAGAVVTFPSIPASSTLNIECRYRLGY